MGSIQDTQIHHQAAPAPEFPASLEWLNLTAPLRMAQLRGRVCALAFVNVGSAWSLQCLNDLANLRARHGERLHVVAVHVPRFDHERDPRRVAKRLHRHKFDYPFAHDADWALWQHYDIQAWPTVILIDGQGQVRDRLVGNTPVRELEARITKLEEEFEPQSHQTVEPIELRRGGEPMLPLRFPIGLAVVGQYLYVADSGHHRILECDHSGRILRQFGSGGAGFIDGPMELAAFNRPHGICLHREILYVADSGNHAVRRIQLRTGDIDTLIGAGRVGVAVEGIITDPRAIALDQPRGIAASSDYLFISGAGDNRIWTYDFGNGELKLLAGSGALDMQDGTGSQASFAEPVALAAVQQMVYVCDAAASAVRSINARTGQVSTLLGQDVWEYGHVDGVRTEARLQQPQAVALDSEAPVLWIADSGNDVLRSMRLGGGEVTTHALSQRLHAPAGLAVSDGVLWIADTDAHAVLRMDIEKGTLRHVPIGE